MTAKKPSLTLAGVFERALISQQYDDVVGAIPVNATDALLQIAAALNRLAQATEVSNNMQGAALRCVTEESAEVMKALAMVDGQGHA